MEDLVEIILWTLAGYLLIGLLFSIAFWVRLQRLFGSHVTHSTWGFFIVSFAGLVSLWPSLIVPCLKSTEIYPYPGGGVDVPTAPGFLRRVQPFVWFLLIVLVPLGVGLALYGRAPEPDTKKEAAELQNLVNEGAK